jgi:hypothetical protein
VRAVGLACWILGIVLSLTGRAKSLTIHDVDEVREHFIERRGEKHFLTLDGREWELVVDPAELPLGHDRFYPMNGAEIGAALDELRFSGELSGHLIVLPYPRRDVLRSSFENGVIFLSPGIRPVPTEHVHATVIHEVGHLVQHERAPEGSLEWSEYLSMRQLDAERFHDDAPHRDRPREIFAEDFRHVFGGPLATSSGVIENPLLRLPEDVPGLVAWFERTISGSAIEAASQIAFPNPVRSGSILHARFDRAASLELGVTAKVLDVAGRLVRELRGFRLDSTSVEFRWDLRNREGRRASPGVYFIRWSQSPRTPPLRVQILN